MKLNKLILKDTSAHYKVLYGENGKKYYAVSKRFWGFIQNQLNNKYFKTKIDIAKYIAKLTNNEITQRAIQNWFYNDKKPYIIDNFQISNNKNSGCKHGCGYFCPLCNIDKKVIEDCPVPLLWTTSPQGKTYVFSEYWKEVKNFIDNSMKYNLLLSNLYSKISVDERTIRNWRIDKSLPKIYTKDEFSFSKHNLYFLGLFHSDGHLRNNGSNLSFTYQVGSSNIFQGYWFPQLIQRIFPIFKHKKSISNTYLILDKMYKKPAFKTNISSISPILIKKMEDTQLVQKRTNSKISGYKKNIPKTFLTRINSTHEYFQGLFDGDGAYGFEPSPLIDLSTTPDIDYSALIDIIGLIPTLTTHNKSKFISYSERKNNSLYMIRFAPGSLNRLPENCNPQKIIDQLEFFLEAAKHSIRPDKVHKLIKIIKTIKSKDYGEYRNCNPLQKDIRDLAIKSNFKKRIGQLEQQYPIKDDKYQPFMPKWADDLCSKNDAWDFFFRKENLIFKVNNKLINLDFSEGMPINLEF